MAKQAPIREVVSALDAKNRFGELLNAAQRQPVTIEKHGKPVAVVLSQADYDVLQAGQLELLRMEIEKGVADVAAGRTIDGRAAFEKLRS